MKKIFKIVVLLGIVFTSSAQDVNNYKYVLVPETYEFTGDIDQYRLNSLTKFLLEKEGYTTFMKKEDKPADLHNNPCLGLTTRVEDNSGFFVTKLVLILEDCYGQEIFRSPEGRSRKKDYEAAYQEALRDAFESLKEIDYNYRPVASSGNSKKELQLSEAEVINEIEKEENIEEEIEEFVDEEETEMEDNEENNEEIIVEEESTSEKFYQYSGKIYQIKPSNTGFGLYQEESPEPIALLIESNDGGSYIYNSLTNQGIAYFDAENNLIVEYFSKQENKKIILKYEVMD